MSNLSEYWRDVKDYYRQKQSKHEQKLSNVYKQLCKHPDTLKIGDHWRNGDYDFWWTGTVYNYKTKEHLSLKKLLEILNK